MTINNIHDTAQKMQKMQKQMQHMRQTSNGINTSNNGKPCIYHVRTRSRMLTGLLRRLQKEHVATRKLVQKDSVIAHRASYSGGGRRFSLEDARNVLQHVATHSNQRKQTLAKTAAIFADAQSRRQAEAHSHAQAAQARRWSSKPEASLFPLFSRFKVPQPKQKPGTYRTNPNTQPVSVCIRLESSKHIDQIISLVVDAICEALLRERNPADEENEGQDHSQPYNQHELKNLLDSGLNVSPPSSVAGIGCNSRRHSISKPLERPAFV